MPTTIVTATENLNRLAAFRQAAYTALGQARDAVFELGDAVLLTVHANSFAEFSLSRAFRRQWPSVYEALQDGRPDRVALLRLYLDQMAWVERPILVGDHTAWPRLGAYTLRDRTIEHQPTPVPGATPITVEQGYSTLLTWELWLTRPVVTDKPLPWQKPQTTLTPGRVRQSLGALFAQIGTPAHAPKPRGKPLGWSKGRPRAKATTVRPA
jgi:hypothetical protein